MIYDLAACFTDRHGAKYILLTMTFVYYPENRQIVCS